MSRRSIVIQPHWSLLQEAAYRTVHEFRLGKKPSGAEALGPLVGKAPRTLDNEVNPEVTGHKLGLEDAVVIQNTAQDFRMLYTMSMVLQHVSIPLGDFSGISDIELLNSYSQLHAEIGDLSNAVNKAFNDQRITRREFSKVKRESQEVIQCLFEFLARLEAVIDEDAPAIPA